MDFLSLDPLLRQALEEDLGHGDRTTEALLENIRRKSLARVKARLISRENLILAGWPVFLRVFQLLGEMHADAYFKDGDQVSSESIGKLRGDASVILVGERVALNFLQRMCGIATATRHYVNLVAGTSVKILDTRKTTPLLRRLEKYSVRVGGGHNHRMGLDDGILIKENHIAVAGGISQAIQACRHRSYPMHKIEVEVSNLQELEQAIEGRADAVLLDNMTVEEVRQAVRIANGGCLLEVSGGVSEKNITQYAEAGVDFISLGALTHSCRVPDISLLIEPKAEMGFLDRN